MIEWNGRIPIRIHPTFWILPLIIAWMHSFSFFDLFLWIAIILLSLLVHELGHACTAYAFGQKPEITLFLLGGVTTRKEAAIEKWKDFLITLNGPLAGISLAFAAWALHTMQLFSPGTIAAVFVQMLFLVNVIWTVINIFPVLPLDGGQLFSLLLEAIFGIRGIRAAYFLSGVFAICAGFFFFLQQSYLAGLFFMIFGIENFREWRWVRTLTAADRDLSLRKQFQEAEKAREQGDAEKSKKLFEEVHEKTKEGVLFIHASRNLAKILFEEGKEAEAFQLLEKIRTNLEGEWLLLFHHLAAKQRKWPLVAEVSKEAYHLSPTGDVAVRNACAFGFLGQAKAAVGWLHCAAKQCSFPVVTIFHDPAFDPIRQDPAFYQYVAGVLLRRAGSSDQPPNHPEGHTH